MWRLLGLAFLCVAKKPAFKPLVKAEGLEKDEFQCARCKWTAKVLRSALGEQNINLKQKAIFEIMQRPHARDLPYYLSDEELDFFVKGVAWGPHKDTYLPQLVERRKRPIYIARGYAPPTYSRLVKLRFYGPDPLKSDDAGEEGEIMEYVIGWRWLYAYWPGPLVDEVQDASKTSWWPQIARPDWTWETLRFCPPPYFTPEDGLPWRLGREEIDPRVTKGKGKFRAGKDTALPTQIAASDKKCWRSFALSAVAISLFTVV
ncbi:unnamed protein product [Effrenium voratum]|nr:unnamed protein product [Effrenium voratum]